ncbi:MAG: trigger factor [Clostridiales bacterium]|nr:trigger factor [Clostridiales bacterium]
MKATAEKVEKNLVKLTIEVGADEFEKSIQNAYLKNRKHIMIQGFRKGRAPRQIIERFYGKEIFFEDAASELIPSSYDEAVKETAIEPVAQPEIDIVQIESGKDFIYTAEVVVKPEVELGDYKGIQVQKVENTVTDEDVEARLQEAREQNARWESLEEGTIEQGHRVTLDYTGTIDGEEFEGGSNENASLEIGSGTFIPGFEEQLIGMQVGDGKDLEVTFPEDYQDESLQGKEAIFSVVIHDIKAKELPKLDDEFAKDISEFDTLDEYKANVREKLEKAAKDSAKSQMNNDLVAKVTENANIDIPDEMVENEIDSRFNELDQTFRYQGFSLEQYIQFSGITVDKLREDVKDEAYNTVKTRLVLEKIAEVEGIVVEDEDVEKEFESMAEQYDRDVEDVKRDFGLNTDFLKEHLLPQKTIEFLMENAIIEEVAEDAKDDIDVSIEESMEDAKDDADENAAEDA